MQNNLINISCWRLKGNKGIKDEPGAHKERIKRLGGCALFALPVTSALWRWLKKSRPRPTYASHMSYGRGGVLSGHALKPFKSLQAIAHTHTHTHTHTYIQTIYTHAHTFQTRLCRGDWQSSL